ncbi:hypothetical protein KDA_43510 [Dictyobacter alpinus]|uniref:Uncharacterized protein n=1 Tax=Dictyobacter alpinus TaxID=2014873 RepID=A0A402BC58_9CHLR|nr:hypothetical protein [Dictyobacter alpinus]GCE28867.1 hypothetical protein KDA_43510 [Dictyobacter alpinus]
MADNTLNNSLVINAPVEQVWLLVVEKQQADKQDTMANKYIQNAPEGPLAAGQVIHMKVGPVRITIYVDAVVQANPPLEGQTISARMTFFGKEGKVIGRWFRDAEHHLIQNYSELNHPWYTFIDQTDIRCISIDTNSSIFVYSTQPEATFRLRLMPRWLARRFNDDEMIKKATIKAMEKYLQTIKTEAEQNFNQAIRG